MMPQDLRRLYVIMAVVFGLWILRVVLLLPIDAQLPPGLPRELWGHAWRYAIWVLLPLLYLLRQEKGRCLDILGLRRWPAPAKARVAGMVIVLYLLLAGLEGALTGGEHPHRLLHLPPGDWIVRAAQNFPTPFAEEFLFRGFLLALLSRHFSDRKSNLMQSVLFVLIHYPGWLYMRGLDPGILSDTVGVFIIALVLGWLRQYTGSLWPPVFLHMANNLWRGIAG